MTKLPDSWRSWPEPAKKKLLNELRRRVSEKDLQSKADFLKYRFDPVAYIREKLGWEPWAGANGEPGQVEVIEAYVLALRQQHEKYDYEMGLVGLDDLDYWQPGEIIKNIIRIEAGHTIGKTKLAAGLVSHFLDCFLPSIIYTYAPTWKQVKNLLWKEISTDRAGKGLPGRVLDTCEIKTDRADHFAEGRATNDAHGRGTERAQGQHGKYLMFLLDEAEGVANFVFDAIDSMTSGGITIVIMLANPRTRTSRFHKARLHSAVRNFRMSCIHHPNVLAGREIVPNAVKRDYVLSMVEKHCDVVADPDDDNHTFRLPFPVLIQGTIYPPGTIFKPNAEFMFRVLGVAPANLADNTFVSAGRYEAACKRTPISEICYSARMGVDVARYGKDFGTLYIRHGMKIWRASQFWHQDTNEYARVIKKQAKLLAKQGVSSLHIRVDAGGGYGGGVIDKLNADLELAEMFTDLQVLEVFFNGSPSDKTAYADLATEMYAETAESLKGLALIDAPELLEADFCERTFRWVNKAGVSVMKLEPKDDFKKRQTPQRSPDDGDGAALAGAPDELFGGDWSAAAKALGISDGDSATGVAGVVSAETFISEAAAVRW